MTKTIPSKYIQILITSYISTISDSEHLSPHLQRTHVTLFPFTLTSYSEFSNQNESYKTCEIMGLFCSKLSKDFSSHREGKLIKLLQVACKTLQHQEGLNEERKRMI